jgi:poly(3-hydroxybutyrate) depolymerase
LCTGIPKRNKHHHTVDGAGHYGIFSGRRWREVIYPRVRDFVRANHPGRDKPRAASARV